MLENTKFHVVFLDLMMPGMDGSETVARIREKDADLPVYALTTNAMEGEEYYRSMGFSGYLLKPVAGSILERLILRHLPEVR